MSTDVSIVIIATGAILLGFVIKFIVIGRKRK